MKRRHFIHQSVLATSVLPLSTQPEPSTLSRNRPKKGIVVKDGEARNNDNINVAGTPVDFKLLTQDTNGDLAVFISANNRKGNGPPIHIHQKFDEFFCVLEGEFLFQVGDEKTVLRSGDTLFVPRTVSHGFDCVSEQAGKLLVTVQPASNMETFFRQIGQVVAKPGPPDVAAIQQIYEAHDSTIVGPPVGR